MTPEFICKELAPARDAITNALSELENKQNKLLDQLEKLDLTIDQRFDLFVLIGGTVDFPWIEHFVSASGKDLSSSYEFMRSETIELDRLSDHLEELSDEIDDPSMNSDLTKEDIQDWKQHLISKRFRSMVFDW